MQATKDAIVAASGTPLSIVIVGVGPADFSGMEELDGDGGVLKDSRFKAACRDIVQFVPFSKCVAKRASEASANERKQRSERERREY